MKRNDLKRRAYPVLFTEIDNAILIDVPDFNINTEGKNKFDAIKWLVMP